RWDSRRFELRQPFGGGLPANAIAHQPHDLGSVRDARAVAGEAFVPSPFTMPAHLGEPGELPIVTNGDDDRLIGRVERLVRNDVRMRIALPRRVLARNQRIFRLIGEYRDLSVEQRHVDIRALPRLFATVERRKGLRAGVHAGEQVGDRDSGAHRPAPGFAVWYAGNAHHPAHALDDEIIAGAVGVRPVLPEAGD